MARVNGITQFLPATHTTILTLLRKHSPDGTTRTRRHTSDIAYYSICRPLKDERLSWPSWLTYIGPLTHISGHPSAAGRAWNRKVRQSKTDVLTTVPRNQPMGWGPYAVLFFYNNDTGCRAFPLQVSAELLVCAVALHYEPAATSFQCDCFLLCAGEHDWVCLESLMSTACRVVCRRLLMNIHQAWRWSITSMHIIISECECNCNSAGVRGMWTDAFRVVSRHSIDARRRQVTATIPLLISSS